MNELDPSDIEGLIARRTRPRADLSAVRSVVAQHVEQASSRQMPHGKGGRSREGRPWGWRNAVMAGLGTMTLVIGGIVLGGFPRWRSSEPPQQSYTAGPGQRAHIVRPDGTVIILAPATTLSLTSSATTGTRVTLRGRAVFEVVPNAEAAFEVQTGHTVTRVLGTTFGISHYETDSVMQISVVEGRVAVRGSYSDGAAQDAVLSGNQRAIVDSTGRIRVESDAQVPADLAWRQGELVFRRTPVREIITELSRAYAVGISVRDSTLARQTLTWTVSVSEKSLRSVLEALALALNAHIVRAKNGYWVMSGPPLPQKVERAPVPFSQENHYGK